MTPDSKTIDKSSAISEDEENLEAVADVTSVSPSDPSPSLSPPPPASSSTSSPPPSPQLPPSSTESNSDGSEWRCQSEFSQLAQGFGDQFATGYGIASTPDNESCNTGIILGGAVDGAGAARTRELESWINTLNPYLPEGLVPEECVEIAVAAQRVSPIIGFILLLAGPLLIITWAILFLFTLT